MFPFFGLLAPSHATLILDFRFSTFDCPPLAHLHFPLSGLLAPSGAPLRAAFGWLSPLGSGLPHFLASRFQRFNASTLQRFNASTL
jgi:hypothetical protein